MLAGWSYFTPPEYIRAPVLSTGGIERDQWCQIG